MNTLDVLIDAASQSALERDSQTVNAIIDAMAQRALKNHLKPARIFAILGTSVVECSPSKFEASNLAAAALTALVIQRLATEQGGAK